MSDRLGKTELYRFYELLELELRTKSQKTLGERSRRRWRESKPTIDLTWGMKLSGENFVSKVHSYGVFDSNKVIFEIGSGYGRLLKSCLDKKIPFRQYIGIDISRENIEYLKKNFVGNNIHFIHGDVENTSFKTRFDIVLSSLTFKHFFPSFERALQNITSYVNPGGMFFFDLIEGHGRYFQPDGVTYIRRYKRSEIHEILSRIPLQLVAFDEVKHANSYSRLLVVAKKPGIPSFQ